MEQMCIGIYYFLGPVFVMVRMGILQPSHPKEFLHPFLILLPSAPLEPWDLCIHLNFAYYMKSPCSYPVTGDPRLTHLAPILGQPFLPDAAPHFLLYASSTPWGIFSLARISLLLSSSLKKLMWRSLVQFCLFPSFSFSFFLSFWYLGLNPGALYH